MKKTNHTNSLETKNDFKNMPANNLIFQAPLQYSCTILQYSFHKCLKPYFKHFAKELKLKISKNAARYKNFSVDIEQFLSSDEYIISYSDYSEGYSNTNDSAETFYRLLCVAKDIGADVNMNLTIVGGPKNNLNDNYVTDTRHIDWLFIYATDKCSLKCKYCYKDKTKEIDLSLEEVKNFVSSIIEKRNKEKEKNKDNKFQSLLETKFGITIGGGEPTEHEHYEELVKFCRENSDFLTISTNGTNSELLQKTAEYFNGISISYPFPYNKKLENLHPVSKKTIKYIFTNSVSNIKNRIVSVIITSKMKVSDVKKSIEFAKKMNATGILFLLYKQTRNNSEYDKLFPDLKLCREITAKIIHEQQKEDFEICVDSCLLAYTIYDKVGCINYFISPTEKIIPYSDYFDYYKFLKCPICKFDNCYIQDLYKSQILKQVLKKSK